MKEKISLKGLKLLNGITFDIKTIDTVNMAKSLVFAEANG